MRASGSLLNGDLNASLLSVDDASEAWCRGRLSTDATNGTRRRMIRDFPYYSGKRPSLYDADAKGELQIELLTPRDCDFSGRQSR